METGLSPEIVICDGFSPPNGWPIVADSRRWRPSHATEAYPFIVLHLIREVERRAATEVGGARRLPGEHLHLRC